METYGGRLCRARNARGMTQARLAAGAKVTPLTVQRHERGHFRKPAERQDILGQLARVLRINAAWLERGDGTPAADLILPPDTP
jgi:transcriptional regulator with XRE-family HTH domain